MANQSNAVDGRNQKSGDRSKKQGSSPEGGKPGGDRDGKGSQTTLRSLFIDELRDVHHAERQLVKALPKLAKAATSSELRAAIENHLGETEEQINRLAQVFELLEESGKPKPCAGMQGIVEEGSDLIEEEDKGAALDAGIIASAQRAEHYEMAAYGTLIAWAEALGEDDVVKLLQETLDEEKAADEKLTALAEAGINEAAKSDDEDNDAEADEEDDEDDSEKSSRPASRSGSSGTGASRGGRPAMSASGRNDSGKSRSGSR
jgi:ferritin-like metal-binding protein YciE